ncbi:TIGR04157 family glycosyltransferase [Parabacteroides sp.]
MKKVYLLLENNRSSLYGIGTYATQISRLVEYCNSISFSIVRLHANVNFPIVKKHDSYMEYSIPDSNVYGVKNDSIYYRNICFVLQRYIHRGEGVDVIFHLNYYQQYYLIDYLKEWFVGCKIVFTIHYQEWCFFLNGNTDLYKKILHQEILGYDQILDWYKGECSLFEKVDKIICLSAYTKRLLIDEYPVTEDKISLVYNGLFDEYQVTTNEYRHAVKKKYCLPVDKKVILFVGRLDEIKGVEFLISAFLKLQEGIDDSILVIIGDGNYSKYLELSRYCLSKIFYTGRLNKNELYDFYRIADIGVMPSMHEQCSFVAIEMMMFNIPLIISTTTGLNEMMEREYNIRVYSKGDSMEISSVELTEKIKKILNMYDVINRKCRDKYLKLYTLDKMMSNMKNIYLSL